MLSREAATPILHYIYLTGERTRELKHSMLSLQPRGNAISNIIKLWEKNTEPSEQVHKIIGKA